MPSCYLIRQIKKLVTTNFRKFATDIDFRMKKINLTVDYLEYDHPDELPQEDKNLLDIAAGSMKHAYAVYSGFHVGAALLLENGETVTGSNQENVAFPSGMCAERVALFYASARYPDTAVKTIAITAFSNDFSIDEPITPCGACRQVMAETETRTARRIRLILKGEADKVFVIEGTNNLLPLMFHANGLKK